MPGPGPGWNARRSGAPALSLRPPVARLSLLHRHVAVQHAPVLDRQPRPFDVALDRAGTRYTQPFSDVCLAIQRAPNGQVASLHLGPDVALALDAEVAGDRRLAFQGALY